MPFVPTVPTKTQEQFLFGYLTIKKPVKCDRNANIKTKISVMKHILGQYLANLMSMVKAKITEIVGR